MTAPSAAARKGGRRAIPHYRLVALGSAALLVGCGWGLGRAVRPVEPQSNARAGEVVGGAAPDKADCAKEGKQLHRNPPPPIEYEPYQPSSAEAYIMSHLVELGYNLSSMPPTCGLYADATQSTPHIHASLHAYLNELDDYSRRVKAYAPPSTLDLRARFLREGEQHAVCRSLELHPAGLLGIFNSSGSRQLSSHGTTGGYIEPLLPPLRHPRLCDDRKRYLEDIAYLVHDFAALCRRTRPTSRFVLVDMGASLQFHSSGAQPMVALMKLYRKFGFHFDQYVSAVAAAAASPPFWHPGSPYLFAVSPRNFDRIHSSFSYFAAAARLSIYSIYAYEFTPTDPAKVFQMVPKELHGTFFSPLNASYERFTHVWCYL